MRTNKFCSVLFGVTVNWYKSTLAVINILRPYQFVVNTTPLMWRFIDTLRFGVTVRRYKRNSTLYVVDIFDGQNLLTTLETPPAVQSVVHHIINISAQVKKVKWPKSHPFRGWIFMHELVLANVYQRTKFETCTQYRCWVTRRWITTSNLGYRSLKITVNGAIRNIGYVFLFAFHSKYF